MKDRRIFGFIGVAVGLFSLSTVSLAGQAPSAGAAPKTEWGDPDVQGIWYQTFQVPLERARAVAAKDALSEAERKASDAARAQVVGRDRRADVGTEKDVAGAYNAVFTSVRPRGERTSLIIDPADGRLPPLTPEAQQRAKVEADYRNALLQNTATCKDKNRGNACANGQYGPPSPEWDKVPPFYNTGRLNRHADVEDGALGDRCMSGQWPDFNGYKRIVQTPGGISMFVDTGQGQGFQRNIVMGNTPHLPPTVRQWWGDSRGRWEGNTLVVDVTNFSPKTSYQGSRENLHLTERWTRLDKDNLEYILTIEDPTVWTKPFTLKVDYQLQPNEFNRFYPEPRCYEGNYGLPALLLGERHAEQAYAEGRGPHPATFDNTTCDGGEGVDPLGAGGN